MSAERNLQNDGGHRSPLQRAIVSVASVYDRRNPALTQRRYSGIGRPDGAGEFGGAGGYKDFAPDGAAKIGVLFELLEEGIINFKDFFAPKPQLF